MTSTTSVPVRPVLPLTRLIFILAAILAAIAAVQLYILSERTEHYFAWTIANPLSATFIGAGYFTGTLLLLFAARERAWANVRIAMAAVTTFVPLMLLTTLLHLKPFHFHSSDRGGQVAAWAWLIVYILVPFAILAIYVVQLREPGGDPPAGDPVDRWVRVLLGVNAAVALVVGLSLMVVPDRLFSHWPWQLTTLTAQAIGSGFLSMAVASAWFIHENSWVRGRIGTVPYLAVGALQLIALLRYQGKVHWDRAGSWLYVLFMLGVLVGGAYSTMRAWRLELHEEGPPVVTPHQT